MNRRSFFSRSILGTIATALGLKAKAAPQEFIKIPRCIECADMEKRRAMIKEMLDNRNPYDGERLKGVVGRCNVNWGMASDLW